MKKAKRRKNQNRGTGILTKMILFSWLVTILTLGTLLAGILSIQKEMLLDSLASKARGVSASIQDAVDVVDGAVETDDYSAMADLCMEVLSEDKSLKFLVLTRKDGLSLVCTRNGWTKKQISALWLQQDQRISKGIFSSYLVDAEVFKYSRLFYYSGMEWGWIHIGLSLNTYHANLQKSYNYILWLGGFCMLIGLLASTVHARRIVTPILTLRHMVQELTEGDFDARANVTSGDEFETLAEALTSMAQSVQDREVLVREANHALATLVIDPVLHSGYIMAATGRLTEASAKTIGVQRVSIWLFKDDESGIECIEQFDRESRVHSRGDFIDRAGNEAYFTAMEGTRVLTVHDVSDDSRVSCLLERHLKPAGISSMMDAPIRMGGKVVGMVCHEHIGPPRRWTVEEENFAGSVADLMALSLEASDRRTTQEELLSAKEDAEAASQAKSQFLANMSHEIRTPINGVMGMLQLLGKDGLNARQARHVTTALNSADTLLSVIGDVLDFSKIEAGHLELDNVEFELRDAVDRSVRLLAGKAQAKGVELTYFVAPDVPDGVIGDPARLRQVLINLIGNAAKFTEQGEIQVSCRLERPTDQVTTLRFSVRDTGPGIPPELQETIFNSFEQGDLSMDRRHGGTGLGLAISRYLVELMGGEISVKSTVGVGSEFSFTVQLEVCRDLALRTMRRAVSTSNLRVLIVDDSPAALDIVSDNVRAWGCEVSEVFSAAEGLTALKQAAEAGRHYSIAVVDATLPGISGLRLARLIKAEAAFEFTRVILLSGSDMPQDEDLQGGGVAAVVPKPVRASDLYNAIITVVSGDPGAVPDPLPEGRRSPVEVNPDTRILVVEDNSINQEVASEMIRQMGYACDCLEEGAAALGAVMAGAYDLVLMDCQMPGMDGYESTGLIREWETKQKSGRRIPVIAVTAHASRGVRDRCREAGMDDHLSKPLKASELAGKLNKWLADEPHGNRSQSARKSSDLAALVLARCSGNRALAEKMLADVIEQFNEDIDAMRTALDQGGPEKLFKAAHRLKGAAATLGFQSAADIAAKLEKIGHSGQTDGAAPLVDELHAEAGKIASISMKSGEGA